MAKVVGLDIGYGYTKICIGNKIVIIPSVIGRAENIKFKGDILNGQSKIDDNIHLITKYGERFVGNLALQQSRSQRAVRDRRRSTEDIVTLVLAALSELKVKGDVQIITGLPVKWYQEDKQHLINQLRGEHTIHRVGSNEYTIRVVDPIVTIQPYGTYFYKLFTKNGDVKKSSGWMTKKAVGIVDFGTFTTDYAIINQGEFINVASNSIDIAMASLYELVKDKIESTFDMSLSLYEVDNAIRCNKIEKRGQEYPLAELVEPPLEDIAAKILAELTNEWRRYETQLHTIILTGGGAATIGPYLSDRFPHIDICGDNTSNVEGYYRYGKYKEQRANGWGK